MAEVVCPECGTHTEFPAIRRAADEFCRHCDYPLFWAPSAVPATSRGSNHDTTLRRLPGAGGRHRVGTKVCPACGELNPLGNDFCIRCNAELDPKPVEQVVVVAPLLPEPEPLPVLEPTTPWWWWLILAMVMTAIVIAIFLLD